MEVILPQDNNIAGTFFLGVYKDQTGITRRTGTVVIKRTYSIDPATGRLLPAAVPLPIFRQDQPDNLLLNGDFEMSRDDFSETPQNPLKAGRWTETANISSLANAQGIGNSKALGVSGLIGGRVTQAVVFEKPLGGRRFALSFSARADAVPTDITAAQLEVAGTGPICVINASLSDAVFNRFTAVGTWGSNLEETAMQVVLPVANNPLRTVFYDQIQVEERGFATRWDADTILLYEHDLAAWKPQGDVIVLGLTDVAGISRLRVDGAIWFERLLPAVREKALFGWESRVTEPRQIEMGVFSGDPNDYPLADPLPAGFQNKFYNGHSRSAAQLNPMPYLPPEARISIERNGVADYQFTLGQEKLGAVLYHFSGQGSDEENFWQNEVVEMNLDTLVVEPELNRCYAVWRGFWHFDVYPENMYRRLVVSYLE